jgi:hypothetical protein
MEVLLVLAIGFVCIACLLIGVNVGQAVAKGEEVKLPTNPIQSAKERQTKQEAEFEQNRLNTILQNIDRYDGTSDGQKEVPRG